MDHVLIWFDAHGDFNTWETSPSGFLGGMPLAMLVGRGEQTMLQALDMRPQSEAAVIFTDGRDLDPQEAENLASSQVTHLSKISDLLDFNLPDMPLYIHFDTDILNPKTAPAMNYLAAGGPDLDELMRVFKFLANTNQIVAVSLSSWNPELDGAEKTRDACMRALTALINST
jgi:arginase